MELWKDLNLTENYSNNHFSNKIIIQTVKIANIYTAKQFSDAKVRFYMTDKINDSNNFNNIHNSKTDIENLKLTA
ncbi:hypothetical protein OTSGILL_2265 [Orientia tsutsugamushi str. Gilliam]|uniref:Uncharacterized protein n=1 Tax=Orientia tsutsugamushi str. Gilliam TaxID=1359184 RepID=A0A0F3M6S9_ORITS|nr:hypothetical protein [Orientia tsutsugamushi]KJV51468.1 hypothetical protein OTSGILL_2265 [Orientia tsutsugamushi str. Gilliam]